MTTEDRRVLDPDALTPYTDGDATMARELYAQFRDSTRSDAASLLDALKGADAAAIMSAAHRVKGASRMMGAALQAAVAERIETAGRAGDLAGAKAAQAEFEAEHARLLAQLDRALA